MPLTVTAIFRVLVTLAIALHVFWMYSLARTINAGFGFHPGVTIAAALFSLIMIVPLVWAIAVLELPEMITWLRGHRRWRSGRCPGCGYRAAKFGGQCPECSERRAPPAPYRITLAAIRRFGIVVIAAWVIGSVAAEIWIMQDELAFRRDVARKNTGGVDDSHVRDRRWPGAGSLVYQPGKGFGAME